MNSTIKARIEFSFQGQTYSPEVKINLDEVVLAGQDLSRLHAKLAQANGIDTYSYMYEVMESTEVVFSDATGLAMEFLSENGEFDFEGFRTTTAGGEVVLLLDLARQHMGIGRLDEIDGLEAALLAAYNAGKESTD